MSASDCEHKYKAFISYSDLDRKVAEEIHRSLERYRLPREISKRQSSRRVLLPRKLGKFFMDRYDLAAGSLSEQIEAALQQSENLIVVCSPNSRKSEHVRREIEEFNKLRRGKILAIIIDGDPKGGNEDCFPEALKTRSAEPMGAHCSAPLAADIRNDKDGPLLARLKVVAGLVGVELDELRKRDAIAERRRRQIWTSTAGAMTVLAGAAVWFAFMAEQRLSQSIEITSDLANKVAKKTSELQIPGPQALDLQLMLSAKLDDLKALTSRKELRLRIEAEDHLRLAKNARSLERIESWGTRSEKARDGFRRLVEEHPANLDYRKGLADALIQTAANLKDNGLPAKAQQVLKEALEVRSYLVMAVPDLKRKGSSEKAREFKSDLSSAYMELGKINKLQGNVDAAFDNLFDARSLRQEIADVFDADASAKFDVTEVDVEIADVKGLAGFHDQQIEMLERVVNERRRRLESRDENSVRRLLAWGLVFLGEAYLEAGDSVRAEICLGEARNKQYEVFLTDKSSARFQKDLAWAEGYWGKSLLAEKRFQEAADRFDAAVKIVEASQTADPNNESKSRDLAYWLTYRGKARSEIGQHAEALADLNAAAQHLSGVVFVVTGADDYLDRTNRQYRTEWSIMQLELANALERNGSLTDAATRRDAARQELSRLMDEVPKAERWKTIANDAGLNQARPVEPPAVSAIRSKIIPALAPTASK